MPRSPWGVIVLQAFLTNGRLWHCVPSQLISRTYLHRSLSYIVLAYFNAGKLFFNAAKRRRCQDVRLFRRRVDIEISVYKECLYKSNLSPRIPIGSPRMERSRRNCAFRGPKLRPYLAPLSQVPATLSVALRLGGNLVFGNILYFCSKKKQKKINFFYVCVVNTCTPERAFMPRPNEALFLFSRTGESSN